MTLFSPGSKADAGANTGPNARALETQRVISHINGQSYELLVSQPAGQAPESGYPVVYLLDGNVTAPLAEQWLAAHGLADEVLVVGIGYPDTKRFNIPRRYRDLTLTPVPAHTGTGHASAFFAFISEQIRPRIAGQFRIDPTRQILFGHSLGGLAVLGQLIEHPDGFSTYLAASPSLWWAKGAAKHRLRAFVRRRCDGVAGQHHVTITVGGDERPHAEAGEQRNRKLAHRHMIDNARWAAEQLDRCDNMTVRFHVLPHANHGEALEQGLAWGLSQLFLRQDSSQ